MKAFSRLALATGIVCFLSACAITKTTTTTSARDCRYQFASVKAATTFYDALLTEIAPDDGNTRSLALSLKPLKISKDQQFSGAHYFNGAADRADANGDRLITESEAEAYAASP